ncbi:hypothetical protein BB737_08560 [Mycobacterium avium subsp. hominissuis]|uniref:Uncharacterized protein n=2 Tax=Mycobacterium TaxID=1763 RepID=A0AA37QAX6_9MYCO|nr:MULTISPECIES: hypothetical protein [Mycobacterium]APA78440.1 hypothetical protein KV38_24666 [Mycobacterium avium subsp. hominissuis]PBJ39107.1 hypothetical protein XV03_03790 [Mycobacterium avium subsp. hominissuis]PBJ66264.1 hypothetical protein BB737_08560 [Mycobacterium avium subsp. hominissuis]GLB86979.1 hypothetical protein SRL2020028_62350 [Mycobacterium kiyosense]
MALEDDTVLLHPEHINVLIWAGIWLGDAQNAVLEWNFHDDVTEQWITRRLTRETADVIGQMLVDTNARAVNQEHGSDELYVYSYQPPRHHEWQIVEVLKAIDFYEYQGAQNPDWPYSDAFFFCFALRAHAIAHMPGYGTAPWHITTETAPALCSPTPNTIDGSH